MNLKTDQERYRVFLDESYTHETEEGKLAEQWRYYELRGAFGTLYPYSESKLGLLITSAIIGGRLKREGKWSVFQSGDQETVFLLDNSDWKAGAEIIQARRRRILSPEAAARATERLARFRFKVAGTPIEPPAAA